VYIWPVKFQKQSREKVDKTKIQGKKKPMQHHSLDLTHMGGAIRDTDTLLRTEVAILSCKSQLIVWNDIIKQHKGTLEYMPDGIKYTLNSIFT
jgi:hypothetical protein